MALFGRGCMLLLKKKFIKINLKSIIQYKFEKHTRIVQYKQKWQTRKNTISTQVNISWKSTQELFNIRKNGRRAMIL